LCIITFRFLKALNSLTGYASLMSLLFCLYSFSFEQAVLVGTDLDQ